MARHDVVSGIDIYWLLDLNRGTILCGWIGLAVDRVRQNNESTQKISPYKSDNLFIIRFYNFVKLLNACKL